jgi:arsenate reductase
MRTWGEGIPLLTLLKADPEVGGVLGEALDGLCSPDWYIRRAHEVLARVFARAPFKKVLFLCVANSARSQLAEALGRKYLGVEVFSAGSSPTRVNPYTLEVLEEIGLDASSQHSKAVHELDLSGIDLIVTLCAEEICPVGLTGVRRLHWPIPDPDLKDPSRSQEDFLKSFRATRENIRERILTLKENLG